MKFGPETFSISEADIDRERFRGTDGVISSYIGNTGIERNWLKYPGSTDVGTCRRQNGQSIT
jgi:hypothetical protein